MNPKSRHHMQPTVPTFAALLALVAAVLVFPLALAPRAEAFVYWTGSGAIGRANLDGTGVDESLIDLRRDDPASVAVDARHIYWIQADGIGRANLDGTGVDTEFIPGSIDVDFAPGPALAVDENHIYWTENRFDASTGLYAAYIARAKIDGTGVKRDFIRSIGLVGGVAVDANYIYWREGTQVAVSFPGGAIGRAKIHGTNVDHDFIPTTPLLTEGGGLAVDGEHVYWLDAVGDPNDWLPTIARANLDGTATSESFIAVDPSVMDLAVDDAHVYWPNRTGIARANLDGTTVDESFISRALGNRATSIAVDGRSDRKLAGTASAAKTQRQRGKRIVVKVKVKAKERLTAKARGKIKLNPSYKLKPKAVEVAAGETKTLKLEPKKEAQANKIAGALDEGERAKAKLTVTLTDQAGNSETETLRVRLKR
jgi:hypothetical protein